MSGVSKFTAERNQRILLDLVSKPGNDVCADCKARTPRWASHNLGIFICMNCASIHRKIGTHVSKVKSVTMDSWSKEQVELMKSIGNVASNAKYNPDEARHPPPANREESERDSELEKYIRWKYEFKRFTNKTGGTAGSTLKALPVRPQSTPAASMARRSSPLPPVPTSSVSHPTSFSRPSETYSTPATSIAPPLRQSSALSRVPASMASPAPASVPASVPAPNPAPATQLEPNPVPKHPVWDDMMSLANPGQPGLSPVNPPLQLQVPGQFQHQSFASSDSSTNTFGLTPTNSFPSTMINQFPGRSVSLPVLASTTNSFPTQNTQPQLNMGNPFAQQSHGFPSQTSMSGTLFQLPAQVQPPFGQLQSSPLSHSYTPSSTFPLQQQQQHQNFTQSTFPQQFGQPSHMPMQPLQAFPQQSPMQGGTPFGTAPWQQQPSGQPPYGSWGSM